MRFLCRDGLASRPVEMNKKYGFKRRLQLPQDPDLESTVQMAQWAPCLAAQVYLVNVDLVTLNSLLRTLLPASAGFLSDGLLCGLGGFLLCLRSHDCLGREAE